MKIGKVEYSASDVNFNKDQLDKLDLMYKELIHKGELHAACYAFSRNGKTFVNNSIGNMEPDSIRKIASISKVITATAIMMLVEKGLILLSDPVSKFIKEFETKMHKSISVEQLLTHTSGIISDPFTNLEHYSMAWWMDSIAPEMKWQEKILSGPLANKPGEKWNYCTAGFMILGQIIKEVTGETLEDFVIKNITKPLGMNRTFYSVPKELHDKVFTTNDWEIKSLSHLRDPNKDYPLGGFGLYSTVTDLLIFGNMMLNKGRYNGVKILGRKTVEYMTRNQLYKVPATNWGENIKSVKQGIGWRVIDDDFNLTTPGTYKHEGAGACGLYIDPTEKFVAAFFVPSKESWSAEGVFGTLGVTWAGLY